MKNIILKFNLPEFKREDLKINIKEDSNFIIGKKEVKEKITRENFESEEETKRNFSYYSSLPKVKEKEAKINFEKGILKIEIPKK